MSDISARAAIAEAVLWEIVRQGAEMELFPSYVISGPELSECAIVIDGKIDLLKVADAVIAATQQDDLMRRLADR